MSSSDLVRELTSNASLLVERQVKLARLEAERELRKAKIMGGLLAVAGGAAYAGLVLLLVAAALGIGVGIKNFYWAGALIIAGALLLLAGLFGGLGWERRPRQPLERTRAELAKEIQWAKHRTT